MQTRTDDSGQYSYGYDANSRVNTITHTVGGVNQNDQLTYSYDRLGRVSSLVDQGGDTIYYDYNAYGNLLDAKMGTRTFTYSYPATAPQSPLVASLTRTNGSVTSYSYDALNRLTKINNENSALATIVENDFSYPPTSLLPLNPDFIWENV